MNVTFHFRPPRGPGRQTAYTRARMFSAKAIFWNTLIRYWTPVHGNRIHKGPYRLGQNNPNRIRARHHIGLAKAIFEILLLGIEPRYMGIGYTRARTDSVNSTILLCIDWAYNMCGQDRTCRTQACFIIIQINLIINMTKIRMVMLHSWLDT